MKIHNPASFEISDAVWNAKTSVEQIRFITELKRRQSYHVVTVVTNGVAAGMTRVVEFNTESDAECELRDTIDAQCGSDFIIRTTIVRVTTPRADADLFGSTHRETIMEETSK